MARPAEEQESGDELRRVDASAFERIIELYSADVTQLVNRLLGWPGDVDDVVQDVFLAAYLNLKGFRGQCLVRTWLFTITMNKCRSHRRRQRLRLMAMSRVAEQKPGSGAPGPDDESLRAVPPGLGPPAQAISGACGALVSAGASNRPDLPGLGRQQEHLVRQVGQGQGATQGPPGRA